MREYRDCQGLNFRLTDERLIHILEHPEMRHMVAEIEVTLMQPEWVVEALNDRQVRHYRFYAGTPVGTKYLCVVAKVLETDAFVITSYLTDKVKRGLVLWPTGK